MNPDAERAKALVLADHERRHGPLLSVLRNALATYDRPVSADDANKLLDQWGFPPHKVHDRRFLGSLFRKGWRRVQTVHSDRVRNHARPIELWEKAA